jgi:hypothetical protein
MKKEQVLPFLSLISTTWVTYLTQKKELYYRTEVNTFIQTSANKLEVFNAGWILLNKVLNQHNTLVFSLQYHIPKNRHAYLSISVNHTCLPEVV